MNPKNGSRSHGKKKLRVRKKERTRKVIIDAAEEFYSEKSMEDVSIEEIAERAFVSRATVYNYFKNKDDLFFAVGNKVYKELNEFIQENLPTEALGKEQVIFLCNKTLQDGHDNPTVLKITQDFFSKLASMEMTPEEINKDIIDRIGHSTLNKILQGKLPIEDTDLEQSFEEPFLVEFFIQTLINGELWLNAIARGKKDKSIKCKFDAMHIVQYASILMNGALSELKLRRTSHNVMGISREMVDETTIRLISTFLDGTY